MTVYRAATRAELDLAVEWAAAEGWNPGRSDADAFWATDPAGFVCAEQDGRVVATGSIVSYDGAFGFMGFFIVRPELRGQGVGREFWTWRRDRLLDRLSPGAAIGMDGVLAVAPFYGRGGFEFAHRSIRMAGVARGSTPSDPATTAARDVRLVPVDDLDPDALFEYDARHFGVRRDEFVSAWISRPGVRSLAAVDGDEILGVAVARPCRSGHKFGPLFAETPEIAETLFDTVARDLGGGPVYLDVPEPNEAALALAERHAMTEDFACARMYLGPAPDLAWEHVYGVTSFELG